MKIAKLPDQSILQELLEYDQATGKLFWKIRDNKWFSREADTKMWNKRFAEKEAFTCCDSGGYKRGAILGKSYLAHRVIYKLVHNSEPAQIDHDDQNTSNNKIDNLSDSNATHNSKNSKKYSNNTSGHTGVTWSSKENKWIAQIVIESKTVRLGAFTNKTEAITARKDAEKLHGFNLNHGK